MGKTLKKSCAWVRSRSFEPGLRALRTWIVAASNLDWGASNLSCRRFGPGLGRFEPGLGRFEPELRALRTWMGKTLNRPHRPPSEAPASEEIASNAPHCDLNQQYIIYQIYALQFDSSLIREQNSLN